MKTLLIVWHSRTGGTEQMAKACARGAAAEPGVTVRQVPAAEAQAADVLAADALVFAAPENLASLSGEMKEFFDRTCYDVLDRVAGRPYGLLVCAGSDGQGVVRQVSRIATGWRLKPAADPIVVITGAQDGPSIWAPKTLAADDLARCAELGQALAAGLALGIF
ncbi:NAD(P)H-dependent oxidoreductase [Phenylobacterium sp. J367]|uniref:NAD(P)H-dependent oxidoreductase n=1 Tax=Phenylobacterium sp. J367 TaxID=2898435 RepID=UPI002151D3BA|nr:NAD(P)H-dependent oxidoreductase [Phenylobacterium sp. J367]MCR5877848.1 NAD(P)H-dependent oxidoreductase [Phenylobacterium sp. J367]